MIAFQLKIESKQQLKRRHNTEKNPPKFYDVKKLKLQTNKEKFNLEVHKLIEKIANQDINWPSFEQLLKKSLK
jgi:hypothetical protein